MVDTPPPQPTDNDKILVGSLLTMVSGRITASLDIFAGWVLAGFGAALAFLLGNSANIEGFLDIASLRAATKIFVWAAVIGVIGRYFGATIVAIAATGAKGEKLGEKHAGNITTGFLTEMERATPWFARWWIRRSFDKMRRGDFAASGRFLMWLAVFHSTLVFLGLCLAIWALFTISYGIKTPMAREQPPSRIHSQRVLPVSPPSQAIPVFRLSLPPPSSPTSDRP